MAMWTYQQKTGKLISPSGDCVSTGYSGKGGDKNNPAAEDIADQGPCPIGQYTLEAPVNTTAHGPYVLRLDPSETNVMFGRGGFLMHGDSTEHPGEASEGCIIMPRAVREMVWNSGDHQLEVKSGN